MAAARVAVDLRLAGYRAGGITRYAAELAASLAQIPDIGLRIIRLRSRRDRSRSAARRLWTPPHSRFENVTLPLELLAVRPDVFHATDFIAPRLPGTRTVATVHDLAFLTWPQDLAPDALDWYRRLARSRRWTDAWITPSQWTADALVAAYRIDPSRVHVIPHGVSLGLSQIDPLPREARGDWILAVGTVEPRKRYDLLLDALSEMPAPVRLVLAGSPGWRAETTARRLREADRVDWRTEVDDRALHMLYREALAVVVPSRSEGFGLSALEAMASGTPVVSSGEGALAEVTGDAALVAAPDPAAWAAAIGRLRDDPELWCRLSRAGRERAANFSWAQAARATLQVYREVLER